MCGVQIFHQMSVVKKVAVVCTIGLVIESHHLAPIHPVVGRVIVGGVDPCGRRVDSTQVGCVEATHYVINKTELNVG